MYIQFPSFYSSHHIEVDNFQAKIFKIIEAIVIMIILLQNCYCRFIVPVLCTWFLGFTFTPSRLRKSMYSRVCPFRVMSYLHHNLQYVRKVNQKDIKKYM